MTASQRCRRYHGKNKQFPYHIPVYRWGPRGPVVVRRVWPPRFPHFRSWQQSLRPAYNPFMGIQPGADLDAWLRAGGVVVASSDRAARAIKSHFHRRRRAEGLEAWAAPNVFAWNTFVRDAWDSRNREGLLVLNPAQEQAIWASIIHNYKHLPTTLPASVRRLATMAVNAHELLCSYAPELLDGSARTGWDQDAAAFSEWLSQFNEYCRRNHVISTSRLAIEILESLKVEPSPRNPLRLAGFDRLLPVQRALFESWGQWESVAQERIADDLHLYFASDRRQEIEACALWCYRRIEKDPHSRLLVIAQELMQRRGQIERVFLQLRPLGARSNFEFSLGVPLSQVPLARSALLLLRWLRDTLAENEIDWLFSSNLVAGRDESAALQACMRALRRFDYQRTEWKLETFLSQNSLRDHLPVAWKQRMIDAQRSVKSFGPLLAPGDWSDKVPHLLDAVGWAGSLSQSSSDFQAYRRWQQALDTSASLGFDGRRISWSEFLVELHAAADEVVFAPESADAPIQIAGPAEAAGLTADAIWFLGADENAWPAAASVHPFLPIAVQRRYAMPHATPLLDWEFSSVITKRLLASAPDVCFSYARQKDGIEVRPSRLIVQTAGEARPIPTELLTAGHECSIARAVEDSTTVPFTVTHLRGGASALSSQSQCPFKAFATIRLGAQTWEPAERGLSARQRGQILHKVLHSVWSGKRPGIKSHEDLVAINDLLSFARMHVKAVVAAVFPASVREQMPTMYQELEEMRLIRLVTEWLEFEKARLPFTVDQTEAERTLTIEGISMKLRLDRVDRLHDESHLVIDYKTGIVDPKAWDLPRPDDVQLPLYKLFGLEPVQPSLFDSFGGPARGGMVFARVRPGDTCFAGRVADAKATIDPSLNGNSSLVRRKLTAADELQWKQYIEQLTKDFIQGRAEVDPRDYPETCDRCGLYSICRIQEEENRARFLKGTEAENGYEE